LARQTAFELTLEVLDGEVHSAVGRLGDPVTDQVSAQRPESEAELRLDLPSIRVRHEHDLRRWFRVVHQTPLERLELVPNAAFLSPGKRQVAELQNRLQRHVVAPF
jgi:hypothetical protein